MSPRDEQGERRDPSIATQRAFWNTWNARHRGRAELPEDARTRGEAVLEVIRALPVAPRRILEVGCATGWLCEEMSAFGSVTGIDLADEVIAEAQANVPAVRFLAGDFLEMDLGSEAFDLVVSLETIAHVKDRPAFCGRIASLLVDGGYLVITAQNKFIWERSGALRKPEEILQRLLTMKELKALLRPEFDILEAKTVIPFGDGSFLRFVNSIKLNRPIEAVVGAARVRRWKERLGLGNTLVVLARKR